MQFPHSHVEMKLGKEQACKKGGGVWSLKLVSI
jgi:hypothetical protein